MNLKEESIRLAGSREMDIMTLARDIEMAMENAIAEHVGAAESKLKAIQRESKEALARRLPRDEIMKLINDITNDYFEVGA
jgi:hypothetical protein